MQFQKCTSMATRKRQHHLFILVIWWKIKRKGESAKKKYYNSWRLESKEKDEIRIKKHVSLFLSIHMQGDNISTRITNPNF